MAYINGVWTLIPDTCNSRVDTSKAGTDASLSFYINEWQRYVQVGFVADPIMWGQHRRSVFDAIGAASVWGLGVPCRPTQDPLAAANGLSEQGLCIYARTAALPVVPAGAIRHCWQVDRVSPSLSLCPASRHSWLIW